MHLPGLVDLIEPPRPAAPRGPDPQVSVVLCTYRRPVQLRLVLADLAAQQVPDGLAWELVVVDNNSGPETEQVLREAAGDPRLPLRCLRETRQGKSHALNAGIRAARGALLAFTDDDVRIHRQWIRELHTAAQRHDADAFAGRILETWNVPKPRWYAPDGEYRLMDVIVRLDLGDEPVEMQTAAWGANMAIRRAVLDRIGVFRTDLGPTAGGLRRGEDTEICQRILAAGGRLLYLPQAVVEHPVEPERATRRYFLRWYHDFGRSEVQLDGLPDGAARWLGVPRYLFRELATAAIQWWTSVEPRRRFYYKLATWYALGKIRQARAPEAPPRRSVSTAAP